MAWGEESLGYCDHGLCAPAASVPPRPCPHRQGRPSPGATPPPGPRGPLRVRRVEPGQRRRCRHVGRGRARRRRGGVCVGVCPRVGEANWPSPSAPLSRPRVGPGLDESGAHPRGCSQTDTLALAGGRGSRSCTLCTVPCPEVFSRTPPPPGRAQW